MAIINTNPITLNDTGGVLNESIIVVHDFSGSIRMQGKSTVTAQFKFYASAEKFYSRFKNFLNVQGIENGKYRISFDYNNTGVDPFYYFDLKVKEYLLTLFPEWDESKLVLTTQPEV